MTMRQLFKTKIFWIFLVMMICAGASEIAMGQWASAFAESALHVSKTVGDLTGPCGFSVGIMWPGSISISAKILPTGGTAMFALLALAGDLGGAVGPAIIGNVSEKATNNLQTGVLTGIGFPVVLVISVFFIRKKIKG